MSYPKADPLGLWLIKFVVGPIVVVVVVGGFLVLGPRSSTMRARCRKLAEERGYLEATYVPGRLGADDRCICSRKRNPDGTIDPNDTISLPMK